MKKTRWVWWVLGTLLVLVLFAGVGFAGFQFGLRRSGNLSSARPFHRQGFMIPPGFEEKGGNPHGFLGNDRQGLNHRGFGRSRDFSDRGRFPFFRPFLGFFKFAVLLGLIWLVFILAKRSGWRLVNVNGAQSASIAAPVVEESPAPVSEENPTPEMEAKKTRRKTKAQG